MDKIQEAFCVYIGLNLDEERGDEMEQRIAKYDFFDDLGREEIMFIHFKAGYKAGQDDIAPWDVANKIAELEKQVEKMKCCGSCKWWMLGEDRLYHCLCGDDWQRQYYFTDQTTANYRCSRWESRR